MKKQHIITVLSITGLIFSTAANAKHDYADDNSFTDRARVTNVEPIVRYIKVSNPRRECYDEPVTYTRSHNNNSTGKTILGGILGAAIGNNIGHGKNRKKTAVAGAIIGATVANNTARNGHHNEVRYEQRCDVSYVSHTEERIDGYNVTYKYRGQKYTTRMPYRPGKRIKVRVNVEPVFD